MIYAVKLMMVGILVAGGALFGFSDWEGVTFGMKAATLAMAAATTLFISFASSQQTGQEFGRFSGGILAFMSAWNWLMGEADGNHLPLTAGLIVMCVVLLWIAGNALRMWEAIQDEKTR